jgi:hypothetical protein
MQLLHHARAPKTSGLNKYLARPRVNTFAFDMAPLSLKGALSKNLWP